MMLLTRKEGQGSPSPGPVAAWLCLPAAPARPHGDGWLLVLASPDTEICHLMPGRRDSKSINTEPAGAARSLSRPPGAGTFLSPPPLHKSQ